eukprot:2892902-Prymnesium_polylepis.1
MEAPARTVKPAAASAVASDEPSADGVRRASGAIGGVPVPLPVGVCRQKKNCRQGGSAQLPSQASGTKVSEATIY